MYINLNYLMTAVMLCRSIIYNIRTIILLSITVLSLNRYLIPVIRCHLGINNIIYFIVGIVIILLIHSLKNYNNLKSFKIVTGKNMVIIILLLLIVLFIIDFINFSNLLENNRLYAYDRRVYNILTPLVKGYMEIHPKSPNKEDRVSFFQLHQKVKDHIEDKKSFSLELFNEALKLNKPVTMDIIETCEQIISVAETVPIPYRKSNRVKRFVALAGVEQRRNKYPKIPGCYHIHSPVIKGSYVGLREHLGRRVKSHVSKTISNVGLWLSTTNGTRVVTLYLLPTEGFKGYDLKESLMILEQYLFFVIKPTLNLSFISRTPVTISQEAALKRNVKTSLAVYAYRLLPNGLLELLHILSGRRSGSVSLGFGTNYLNSVKIRGGWVRDIIYLTDTPCESINEIPSMTFNEYKRFHLEVAKLTTGKAKSGAKRIVATHISTGEKLFFKTQKEACNHFIVNYRTLMSRIEYGKPLKDYLITSEK